MSDITTKFTRLQSAAQGLRSTGAAERIHKLESLWAAVVERQDDLFRAGHSERGTHDLDIAAELVMVKGEIDYAIKNVGRWMKPRKVKNSLNTMGKRCEIQYQPKGTVLNLSAYNAPTAECIVPMIPAITAGNAIAVKPSEHAPQSAQILDELITKALPADEVMVFQGGVDVAQGLLAQPFDHIHYTGGSAVGKIVMKAAAEHFATVTLEMGGKSPVIIGKSAALDNAATKIAWGRVMNAGQVCIAPDYVIVHDSIADEFLDLIVKKIKSLYDSEGTGLQNSPYVPRIINQRHQTRIKGLIDDALKKGARLVFGGHTNAKDRYIEPTVLTDMSESMAIMKEEVFGPVLSVLRYQDRKDVLDIISKRPSPLALYIYSTDKAEINYFLTNTTSGSAVVNNNCIQSGTNPRLPFGGVGASGMGRVGGFRGFEDMSNTRAVVHQPLDRLRDILIMLPPYSQRYKGLIMKALKK